MTERGTVIDQCAVVAEIAAGAVIVTRQRAEAVAGRNGTQR